MDVKQIIKKTIVYICVRKVYIYFNVFVKNCLNRMKIFTCSIYIMQ